MDTMLRFIVARRCSGNLHKPLVQAKLLPAMESMTALYVMISGTTVTACIKWRHAIADIQWSSTLHALIEALNVTVEGASVRLNVPANKNNAHCQCRTLAQALIAVLKLIRSEDIEATCCNNRPPATPWKSIGNCYLIEPTNLVAILCHAREQKHGAGKFLC